MRLPFNNKPRLRWNWGWPSTGKASELVCSTNISSYSTNSIPYISLIAASLPRNAVPIPLTRSPYSTNSSPYSTNSSPYSTNSSPYSTNSSPYSTNSSPYTTLNNCPFSTKSKPIYQACMYLWGGGGGGGVERERVPPPPPEFFLPINRLAMYRLRITCTKKNRGGNVPPDPPYKTVSCGCSPSLAHRAFPKDLPPTTNPR